MLGFGSGFLPVALAEDFFGENALCAFFLLNVLCISLAAVFLAGRQDVLFLRFAGGTSLDAWHFLLVVCACCLAGVMRGLGNVPEAAAGGWERWRSTAPVTAMAGEQALPHAGKPGTSGPRDPVPRLRRAHVGRARGPHVAARQGPAPAAFSGPAGPAKTRPAPPVTGAEAPGPQGGRGTPAGVGWPPRLASLVAWRVTGDGCQVTLNPRVHAGEVLGIPLRNKRPSAT